VTLVYASPRKLCAVARGIVRGLAQHYREEVTVTEPLCMGQGQPQCQIQVRRS
jgi:predicted hydrocarbon binding protein